MGVVFAYELYGARNGYPVVYSHGGLSSHSDIAFADAARLRPGLVQEGKRHPSGLAGARRSDENRARMGGKQIANLRQDIVDGEGGVKGAHLG